MYALGETALWDTVKGPSEEEVFYPTLTLNPPTGEAWLGRLLSRPRPTEEETMRLLLEVARGKEAAEALAEATGLSPLALRRAYRKRLQGQPLDPEVEERVKALPPSLRRLRHLVLDGERALLELVEGNLRLVVHVARRFYRDGAYHHLEFHDLLQSGVRGLVEGLERFDPRRKVRLSTYVYYWIWREMGREAQASHFFPGLGAKSEPFRLEEPLRKDEEGEASFGEFLPSPIPTPEEAYEEALERAKLSALRPALKRLPLREFLALTLLGGFFGRRVTLAQLAQILGCSPKEAKRVYERAKEHLRALLATGLPKGQPQEERTHA